MAPTPLPTTNGHAPPLPAALSEADRAYHRKCLGQLQAAQAIWQHWGAFLVERYGITERDRINEDGTIERNCIAAAVPSTA